MKNIQEFDKNSIEIVANHNDFMNTKHFRRLIDKYQQE